MQKCLWVLLSALIWFMPCFAELSVPSVFSDHMVLQRDRAVPVWGKADPGATVTVEFAGQKKNTTAGADGKWRVDLDPMTANASSQALTIHSSPATGHLSFSDVLVGEVWLCSGQSNMGLVMQSSENAPAAIAAANYPKIRLFRTPQVTSATPLENTEACWAVCNPENVKSFSAVAYYFGRKLHQDLKVPVGLLQSAWGGTQIEPWTPPCGFKSVAALDAFYQQSQKLNELQKLEQRSTPAVLYNGMIHAHIPFAIRGAIWYQGEANRSDGMLYVDKTRALLNGWRTLWGYDFPFYFVQIAPYPYGQLPANVLPAFWEAQAEIVKAVPNTGMAVISDHTTLNNIHPPNKEAPGTRLALLAEAGTYGMNVVSTGPVFQTLEKQGSRLKVLFSSADGLTTRDGKSPDWFEIAGKDGIFKPAKAEIQEPGIILSSPEVPDPQAMRFAWSKLAEPNLMNKAGLPASAFRAGNAPKPAAESAPVTAPVAVTMPAAAPEAAPAAVHIPEMDGYRIVYRLNIPADANYADSKPLYAIDQSSDSAPFSKIAYCLELQKDGEKVQYAFVSMDAFTDELTMIGIPDVSSNARFMQQVNNLTVRSNVNGIQAVTNSDGGNIEFWPGNYNPINENQIPGASDKLWDFGDKPREKIPGYGCMQVHNWKEKQTIFAINRWGTAGTVDIGIGNSSTAKSTDWTLAANAGNYTLRRLTVLVK